MPLGLGLIALGYKRQNQHFKRAGFAVLLSIACAGLLTDVLKHVFQMPRPKSYGSYGFPSGHSGTAFALASALSVSFPALTPLYFLLATFTAISRLYFRAHFLLDVSVGGLLGALTGFLITRKIVTPASLPRPSWTRRIAWIGVATVALSAIGFFSVIETQVRSYKTAEATKQESSTATVTFDFGTPEVRRVLGSGWSIDELWGNTEQSVVWADRFRAEMNTLFPAAAGYRWRLNLFPYMSKGPACQVVEVKINRIAVVKMLLEQGWHWYEFDVPKGVIQSGNNHVQFLFNFSAPPRAHRKTGKVRRMSVAFDVLEATPQS